MPATQPSEGGRGNGGDLQIINAHVANNPPAHNMTGFLAVLSAHGSSNKFQATPVERPSFYFSVSSPKNTVLSCG
jgi:hypothetical protein